MAVERIQTSFQFEKYKMRSRREGNEIRHSFSITWIVDGQELLLVPSGPVPKASFTGVVPSPPWKVYPIVKVSQFLGGYGLILIYSCSGSGNRLQLVS